MINLVFAAAIMFAQAAPAASPVAPADAPSNTVSPAVVTGQKTAKATASPDEVVCRKENVVGSLFPRKICARQSDFDKRRDDDIAALDRLRALSLILRSN